MKKSATQTFLESEEGEKFLEVLQTLSDSVKSLDGFLREFTRVDDFVRPSVKRKRPPRDPDAPKPPMSAYMLYVRDQRQELKDTESNLSQKEIVREIAKKWRELSEDEKKDYQDEASNLKEQYQELLQEYQSKKLKDDPEVHDTEAVHEDEDDLIPSQPQEDSDDDSDDTDSIVEEPPKPEPKKVKEVRKPEPKKPEPKKPAEIKKPEPKKVDKPKETPKKVEKKVAKPADTPKPAEKTAPKPKETKQTPKPEQKKPTVIASPTPEKKKNKKKKVEQSQ